MTHTGVRVEQVAGRMLSNTEFLGIGGERACLQTLEVLSVLPLTS